MQSKHTVPFGPNNKAITDSICGFVVSYNTLIDRISDSSGYCKEVHQGPNGTVVTITRGQFSRSHDIVLYQNYEEWKAAHDAQVNRMAKLTGRI